MEYSSSRITKFLLIALAFVVVMGLVIMVLWNWLVPALFSGTSITFLQAIGLLILSRILFGNFGSGRQDGGRRWRKKFAAKMASMSPEEREKFREKWERSGSGGRNSREDWEVEEPDTPDESGSDSGESSDQKD